MRNKFRIQAMGIVAGIVLSTFAGCGADKEPEQAEDLSYVKQLESGRYYVKHADNSCELLYLGDASFLEGKTVSDASDNRTVWYREDADQIPTLYKGDELILYDTGEIEESFNFERFEDLGYSFGIRGLQTTESGRYKISTDVDEKTTYPEGDTDDILELNNENVIIDSVSGVPLRAPEKGDSGLELSESPLTRCSTIKGLNRGSSYEVAVYDGTQGHTYTWKADVWVLGSMEVGQTHDFIFKSDTLISIPVPQSYHSGYYMLNGQGLFRYVADATSYNEDTNFNIRNVEIKEEDSDVATRNITTDGYGRVSFKPSGEVTTIAEDDQDETVYSDNMEQTTFEITREGKIAVELFLDCSEEDVPDGVAVAMISPADERYQLSRSGTSLNLVFVATEVGTYTLEIYNLANVEAELNISYVEEGL